MLRNEPDTQLAKKICTQASKLSRVEGFKYFRLLYSKLLNVLALLSNSKAYFKEMVDYEDIVIILLDSLNFDDTYISCQALHILESLISFKRPGNKKVEKANKQKMLSPKLNLIGNIKKLLNRCDDIAEKDPNDLRLLEINSAFLLLLLFIKDVKEGPSSYQRVTSFDKFIADAIFGEDKSLFHYLDKLALKDLFSVSYGATLLINRAIEFYQRSPLEDDRKKEEHCKYYVLNHSVLFIWNIHVLMTCQFDQQVDESISFVSNMLYKNKPAVKVMTRMFQKSLFYKVEGADDLFKEYTWTRYEWQQFFDKIKLNYNTSTEQWNKKIRNELFNKILQEIENFVFYQRDFMYSKDKSKPVHPCQEFNDKNVVMSEKPLKWNHEEFEVDYPSFRNLYKVGKYFLKVLLNEKPVVPYLLEVITSPINFWKELNTRFHDTENEKEQIIIVKVMIKMYQKHFQMLKELQGLQFWIKCLSVKKYTHLHFWILQLIYVALSIPYLEHANANYKMFKKANGMTALFGILNQTFKEFEPIDESIIEDEKTVVTLGKIANYTGIKENLHYFERNSMLINQGIVVINILYYLFGSLENLEVIPLPAFFQYLAKKRSTNVFIQLLFLENQDLNKVLLGFLIKHYTCDFTLFHLFENGAVEGLMLMLHTKNGRKAMTILSQLQRFASEYNLGLNYRSKISEKEKLSLENLEGEVKVKVLNSLVCRYLPTTLLDMCVNEDKKIFLDIYKNDNIQNEYIIWNKSTREHLLKEIRDHFEPQIHELVEFSSKEFDFIKVPGNLPLYTRKFDKVIQYQQLDNEVKIGKYYAKTWIKNASSIQMSAAELDEFYDKIESIVDENTDQEFINSSNENLEEAVNSLILCVKMVIKLNDVFNYNKIIDMGILEQIIILESKHKNKHSLWELMTLLLEMIRKVLQLSDIIEPQSAVLVSKIEKILSIIFERIDEDGMTLVIAETLSEAINISNVTLNTYPDWITTKADKCSFTRVICKIYHHLIGIVDEISLMNF